MDLTTYLIQRCLHTQYLTILLLGGVTLPGSTWSTVGSVNLILIGLVSGTMENAWLSGFPYTAQLKNYRKRIRLEGYMKGGIGTPRLPIELTTALAGHI